jgi:uncharacterized membrane protein
MSFRVLACSLLMTGACLGQVSFEPLPGMRYASAITADGNIVAGGAIGSLGSGAAKWIRGQGVQLLGSLPGQTSGQAWDITPDGLVAVGAVVASGQQAASWSGSGLQPMGGLNAYGVTANGRTIVGEGPGTALIWNDGVMSTLAALPGAVSSLAIDIADDGSSIVGGTRFSPTRDVATRWVGGVPTLLGIMGSFGGIEISVPWACSPDGQVVIGYSTTPLGFEAYRWTQQTGMQPLGTLPGGSHFSAALAVSADGNLIGGSDNGLDTAFIWTPALGMRDLKTVLQSEYGLNLAGWTLSSITDITPDGRTLIGEGTGPNGEMAWIATIPSPGGGVMVVLWCIAGARRGRRFVPGV